MDEGNHTFVVRAFPVDAVARRAVAEFIVGGRNERWKPMKDVPLVDFFEQYIASKTSSER